jgi:hypothetical protein
MPGIAIEVLRTDTGFPGSGQGPDGLPAQMGASSAIDPGMKEARQVAGVCAIRDACDIAELLCGHYLRLGFGHIAFIDDGSTDGTFECLARLGELDARVSVTRVTNNRFEQDRLITQGANELTARGYKIIVPFDADEFWDVTGSELETRLRTKRDIAFVGKWVNFVQRREAVAPDPTALFDIEYSVSDLAHADQVSVERYKSPFVCCPARKIGFKTTRQVRFGAGQHKLKAGPQHVDNHCYEIFHVPLRNRAEILKRGLNYEPRRAAARPNSEVSWQSLFHRNAVLDERVDDVWAANSVDDDGTLDCYGSRIRLVRDNRLRDHFTKSATYLAGELGVEVGNALKL